MTAAVAFACACAGGRARAQEYETRVTAQPFDLELSDERDVSVVRKIDLDRRLARSAPDALRYEPGVFVQQTAHGQASAYLRGLTGQQTALLFDGIRLNNSVYRSGPNQYLFTVDAHTVGAIEVQRGGGSTRWGSDALGGVVNVHPVEPMLLEQGWAIAPRVFARATTADTEKGGRAQLEVAGTTPRGVMIGFLGGFGARDVGLLRGPPVLNPNPNTDAGALPWVPRYGEYQPTVPFERQPALRTQLGTGFKEVTGDGRLVVRLSPEHELTFAGYVYREYDAARTDQCAPPTAPFDQCLTYEEQFRHLAYATWKGRHLGRFAHWARATVSWQEQHERRRLDLTAANLVGTGVDDVETFGVLVRAETDRFRPREWLALRLQYGADNYFDWLRSRAAHTYTDTHDTVQETRGQYLDGSTYLYGGVYADLAAELGTRVTARGGARFSWIAARAQGDPQSGSAAVNRSWTPVIGHAGVEVQVARPLALLANYDNSFRAPNLDDMTSRQQTGPGFQFENAALSPEHAHTFEVGARLRTARVVADAWLFETLLEDGIFKVAKTQADCPPKTPQCNGSWSRFQLQNAPALSELRGAEAMARWMITDALGVRATLSYVWSEGPRVGSVAQGVFGVVLGERVPLSRTPPLNGTVEVSWTHRSGFGAGAALQWAAAQDRLAIADYSDGRIPKYGTPGYAVVHLRGWYRVGSRLLVAAALENLFDSPYRFHGSSINGAGRGFMLQVEAAPF